MAEETSLRARNRLISTLTRTIDLSGKERQALRELTLKVKIVDAHAPVVRDRERSEFCCLLVDGFLQRHKDLSNGRRQVLSYHFPGDIPDLMNIYLDMTDHTLEAITVSQVALIPHKDLHDLAARYPALATAFWRETLIDASRSREWTVNIGARNAASGIGHLICELFARHRSLGLNVGDGFTLLLTQAEIGDATGMSAVHVNRNLQVLRAAKLIVSEGRLLRILDWDGLRQMSDFDPAYLHLRRNRFGQDHDRLLPDPLRPRADIV